MRLGWLVGLLLVTACYSKEEAPPPPLRTAQAENRPKPAETNNAQLKDGTVVEAPAGTTPPAGGGSSGCTKSGLTKGGGQAKTLTVWGNARSYVLSVPEAYGETPQAWRVVFAFHGGGGTGEQLRAWYDSDQRFAEKNAIVVYPDALEGNGGNWDLDTPTDQNPDIALFDALLADLQANACVDTTRVFAVGFSNGAYFANQLGCRRGSSLRAIAPHAGGGPYGPGSSYDAQGHLVCAGPPPAVKVFHAEDDYTVPISDAEASINHWAWANGCQDTTHAAAPDPCAAYDGCGKPVEICRYWGVGHSIWGEGAKSTWEFFEKF